MCHPALSLLELWLKEISEDAEASYRQPEAKPFDCIDFVFVCERQLNLIETVISLILRILLQHPSLVLN